MDRVVILALDTFGDLALRQPLLARLLDEGYAATVVVRPGYEEILPFVDARLESLVAEVNPYAEPDDAAWARIQELGATIDGLGPKILVAALFNRSYVDEWIVSRRPDLERVGFANPLLPPSVLNELVAPADPHRVDESRLFSRLVSCPAEAHEAEKNRLLLGELIGRDPGSYVPTLALPPRILGQAAALARGIGLEPGKYVFGCPAATVSTPHKAWPVDDYVELARHLLRSHGLPVLAAGVESEAALLDEIAERGAARGVRIARWTGRRGDIGLLLGLIRKSRLYLGSDSGPMHFAGALGIPVVALFGGGHWPRFLPLARRSFVATQMLPCFGCNWRCWLEEPVCVRRVPVAKFMEAIDWVLGPAADERRVDTGEDLGPFAWETLRSGVSASRTAVGDLQRRLRESELDRAARLEVIEHLGGALKESEADRAARLEVIEDLNLGIGRLEARLRASQADAAARLEVIRSLERRIVEISSAKATVKRLLGIAARKLGLYPVLKRHEDGARRLYGKLRGAVEPPPSGARTGSATGAADARPSIHSPLVDAFVAARAMPGDIDDEALETLYRFASEHSRVLCLEAAAASAQAMYMLARGGARVTCLDCRQREGELRSYGIEAVALDLGRWMAASGNTSLELFDALLVDAALEPETLKLLAGRFRPGRPILVCGASDEHVLGRVWGPASSRTGNVEIYDSAPEPWLDPSSGAAATLPSGRPWPRISVVTVTYNQADYLEETLRSVLGQGYPNLEYIVLDGNSTDRTPEILERYRSRLASCIREGDEGQSDALNKGFCRATGEILAWLNSDDRYTPGALWRVALAFDSYGADLVAGGCALLNDRQATPFSTHHNSLPVGKVVPLPLDRLLDVEGSWIKGDFFWQPEVFWTRSIWERSGGRVAKDLFYSMDYELWVRMAQNGARIVHVPDTLAVYRMHARQKTSGGELPYLPELRELSARIQKGMTGP
jgi:ADP-heptose:LPS heptosyltransferase/GT2 family glycosyltransferase